MIGKEIPIRAYLDLVSLDGGTHLRLITPFLQWKLLHGRFRTGIAMALVHLNEYMCQVWNTLKQFLVMLRCSGLMCHYGNGSRQVMWSHVPHV